MLLFLYLNDFDFMVICENSEGEYSEVGGCIYRGDDEIVIQNVVFMRKVIEYVMCFVFELVKKWCGYVISVIKFNGIYYVMLFWDEVFQQIVVDYSEIEMLFQYIDVLVVFFVMCLEMFDVIVVSNLFGDILMDISLSFMGSIGIVLFVNINLYGKYLFMFELVYGLVFDIVGQGFVNLIGQIWIVKLMFDYFGEEELGVKIFDVME